MINRFVADGPIRHFWGKKALAAGDIEKKPAPELAPAAPEQKDEIARRRREELSRRKKMLGHKPSAGTLW